MLKITNSCLKICNDKERIMKLILGTLLFSMGYAGFCVGMKENDFNQEISQNVSEILKNNDIYDWKVLWEQNYSFENLEKELEETLEKEDAKMIYMKLVVYCLKAAQNVFQNVLSLEENQEIICPQLVLQTVNLNMDLELKKIKDLFEKINPFFEDDKELWPLLKDYENVGKVALLSISEQKNLSAKDLTYQIIDLHKKLLSMAWRILFPNLRGG